MESVGKSAELDGSSYLLVNNGIVEDMGTAFTSLTGYTKSDLCQCGKSEAMATLFGFDFDPENCAGSGHFLFKKSFEAIEVRIKVYQVGKGKHKLYHFQQIPNYILDSELSLVDKLLKDNNSAVGLYSTPDFRLLKANRKYLEFIRDAWHADGNMIGCCLNEIISDYGESKTKSIWQNICKSAETVCLKELKTASERGDCRYWNQSITPISEEGSVKYIISMLDDVTENVLKRKYIEEKNEELKKTIEMKDEMLMLISHELKTPLSIISSSVQTVELVCKNELSDRVMKYLNKIRQNTYRQMKLINNILDNTRVNAGIFKLNRTCVDIVLLTKTIVDSIAVFAERKGIGLSFSSIEAHPVVQTDVDIYERILLNLLSNAVKFTPEGKTIEVTVSQLYVKRKPQVCIQVKDTGVGIPSDQKELIFERFGRVNRIVPRNSEGTGIGLYLVKMLVSLLDGEINVESVEGVGSTFTLNFPLLDKKRGAVNAARIEKPNEQLTTASAIEFSDIYFRA